MTGTPEPGFAQSGSAPAIYWLENGDRHAGFQPSGAVAFGNSVTLTQSWTDMRGLWFWLDAAPADDIAFAAALAAYLSLLPTPRGPRALWIAGTAAADVSAWRGTAMDMDRRGDETLIAAGAAFVAGGVRTQIAAGGRVTIGEYDEGFSGWGFQVQGDPCLVFATPDALTSAAGGRAGFGYGTGQVGCLAWRLALGGPAEGGTGAGLSALGAGLRFFGPDATDPGAVHVLRIEALRQREALTLYCCLDPLAPLDSARTRLALLPFNATLGAPPTFGTGYISARGYGVSLATRNLASATPPGFVFAVQPLVTGAPGGMPADVPSIFYLTPDGDFEIVLTNTEGALVVANTRDEAVAAPAERLLCGTSGLDYIGLAAATGSILSFRGGKPAYAPPATDQTRVARLAAREEEEEAAPPALTALGTTAWCWVGGPAAARYYAQPEDAPFYAGGDAGFLNFLEMATAALTSPDPSPAFPMVGYAGLDPAESDFAAEIEARGIAPERRRQIGISTRTQWAPAPPEALAASVAELTANGGVTPAVAPMGLALGYAGDGVPWSWLAIGNTGTGGDGLPDLRFTAVDGAFRQALLSNRLFMVLGDPDAVMASASVAYQLTRASLSLIKALPPAKGVPLDVYNAVAQAAARAGYRVYPTETDFDAMLVGAVSTITTEQKRVFQRFAGLLSPKIGDWLFRMSPRNWLAPDRSVSNNARLIFKFVNGRSLAELVADTAAWGWPEASSVDGLASSARDDIQAIIRSAREADAVARAKSLASPYARFIDVIDDPDWAGVLALSVESPLDSLPEPLQPLAAGIDPKNFYAHHLGLTATSFTSEGGAIDFDVTSSFGLIDYQNPEDQYFASDISFAFRVQQLTVGFENGKLSSFSSSAQLMANRLFGARTRLWPSEHGNNLILDGVYQTERDASGQSRDTFLFALRSAGAFELGLSTLREVGVETARLVTVRAADPAGGDTTVTAAFQLSGRLRFAEPANFDPYCWGPATDEAEPDVPVSTGLLYSNYAITMRFSLSNPTAVAFSIAESAITLDAANSVPRLNSLIARFPMRLTGLVGTSDPQVTGTAPSSRTPEDDGFVSISAPLQQGKLTQPWYGLVYEVDLGTLGALAGSVGLKVQLLAAWSPSNAPGVPRADYFGVALPGVEKALGVTLPLQGILDIGFRTIQFSTYDDGDGRRQYLMRLRDFGLHVLGLSFPPGKNDITLFGNPDQNSNTKLGWYAAYDSGKEEKQKAVPQLGTLLRNARPARGERPTEDGR